MLCSNEDMAWVKLSHIATLLIINHQVISQRTRLSGISTSVSRVASMLSTTSSELTAETSAIAKEEASRKRKKKEQIKPRTTGFELATFAFSVRRSTT